MQEKRKDRGRKSTKPEKKIQRAERKKYDSRGKEFQEHLPQSAGPIEIQQYSAPPTAHHSAPSPQRSSIADTRPTGPAPVPDTQPALAHPAAPPPPPPPPPPGGIPNPGAPQQNAAVPPPPPPPPPGYTAPSTSTAPPSMIPNGPSHPGGFPPVAMPGMAAPPPPPAPPAPPPGVPMPFMAPGMCCNIICAKCV